MGVYRDVLDAERAAADGIGLLRSVLSRAYTARNCVRIMQNDVVCTFGSEGATLFVSSGTGREQIEKERAEYTLHDSVS